MDIGYLKQSVMWGRTDAPCQETPVVALLTQALCLSPTYHVLSLLAYHPKLAHGLPWPEIFANADAKTTIREVHQPCQCCLDIIFKNHHTIRGHAWKTCVDKLQFFFAYAWKCVHCNILYTSKALLGPYIYTIMTITRKMLQHSYRPMLQSRLFLFYNIYRQDHATIPYNILLRILVKLP